MALLIQVLAVVTLVLGAFFVCLPKRREHFAEVFTLSVLALVLCSGFKSLSSPDHEAPSRAPQEIAANNVGVAR